MFTHSQKHQLLECDKFPVNCVICGETGILREEITKHVDVVDGNCPLVTVPCNYFKLGCFFQVENLHVSVDSRACFWFWFVGYVESERMRVLNFSIEIETMHRT